MKALLWLPLLACCFLSPLCCGDGVTLPWNDDVLGLIVFKADLNDPQALSSWSEDDSSACQWRGITCSGDGRVVAVSLDGLSLSGVLGRGLFKLDRLESLSLSGNNLSGVIPPEIHTLQSLRNLSLSRNGFSGPIPDSLASMPALSNLDLSHNQLSGLLLLRFNTTCGLRYLSLSANQLQGTLPSSLAACSALVEVDASSNRFSGTIPTELASLSRLAALRLSHNTIGGQLPAELANCTRLELLDASYNLLAGSIPPLSTNSLRVLRLHSNSLSGGVPEWMSNSSNLVELNLGLNQLSGAIPDWIGSLASLERLYLFGNGLSGGIPSSIAGCTKLSEMDVSANRLSGGIPSELFDMGLTTLALAANAFTGNLPPFSPLACKSLAALDLSHNDLGGNVPVHFSQCTRLQVLFLSHNSLSGAIPKELAAMPELNALDLSDNALTGYIPTSFDNATSLLSLRLAGNMLSGAIPVELSSCQSLTYLDLSYNNLSGGIPVELSYLTQLEGVDLSHNHLSGQIPASFGELHNLTTFNVSHNSLAGPLPVDGVFQLLDDSAFTGNAHLCGPPLEQACTAIPKPLVVNPNASGSIPLFQPGTGPRTSSRGKLVLSVSSILAISAAAVIAVGIIVVSLLNLFKQQQQAKQQRRHTSSWYVVDSSSLPSSGDDQLAVGKLVMFTDDEDELEQADKNNDKLLLPASPRALLSKASELGRGSFGTVYRASLSAGGKEVAVRKLQLPHSVTQQEFEKRVHFLGRIQHERLVKFEGYYWTPKLQLLIYELVPNATTLHSRLHDDAFKSSPLSWEARFKIASATAAGVAYLHHTCKPGVVHYNLKSPNVLLDSQLNPRVSDYGLAKLLPSSGRCQAMSKQLQQSSSLGYVAPECSSSCSFSSKTDVYAFGVLLLELVTGQLPVQYSEDDLLLLTDHVRSLVDAARPLDCVDPSVPRAADDDDALLTLLKLGLVCTSHLPSNRPTMPEVLHVLELVKPLN